MVLLVLSKTFTDVAGAPRPKVGKKKIRVHPVENTVFVYPTDDKEEDSEETKSAIKKLIAPKEDGWQVKAMRKVRRGGVVIEAGTAKTIQKIKEAVKTQANIRCVEPLRSNPKIQIFDVDVEMSGEEIKQSLFKKNLEDEGFTEQQVNEEIKCRTRFAKRDGLCNWILECPPKMRNVLVAKGRIFIDFSSCRVIDYIRVTRCYKCQGYGHVAKYCTMKGSALCSHCSKEGHTFQDCQKKDQPPVCTVCKLAKKPCRHRGGTRDFPIYMRAVEKKVASTIYNDK